MLPFGVSIVARQPHVAQEGLIDHAARVLAAPFSTELSGLSNAKILGADYGLIASGTMHSMHSDA